MSKNITYPQNVQMAALLKKQQLSGGVDLMKPGFGTPWEDRGSLGAVLAYLKTVYKSFFSPGLLLDHISRPETTSDSVAFARISGAMWVISILIWNAYWYFQLLPNKAYEINDPMWFWITAGLQAALVGFGVFVFLRTGTRMFIALGETEFKGATPTLIYNCFAYSLGPSILAIVPVFGWGLAGLWIMFDLMVAGKRRLYMKTSSSIINPLLIMICTVAVVLACGWVLHWLWIDYLEMGGLRVPIKHLPLTHIRPPAPRR